MADLAALRPTPEADPLPAVVEGELVPLAAVTPRHLEHPPAVRECVCGNVTIRGHNGYPCTEVEQIRAGVAADALMPVWRAYVLPAVAVLVGLGIGAVAVWVVVLGVVAVVAAVSAAVAWISTYWPLALVGLLFLGGGAKCVGLHCGGCRG